MSAYVGSSKNLKDLEAACFTMRALHLSPLNPGVTSEREREIEFVRARDRVRESEIERDGGREIERERYVEVVRSR